MSARFYAPSIGAFTQLDSVMGSAQNPLSMNRFLYCHANPATLTDPTGHFPFLALLVPAAAGFLFGAGTDAIVQQVTTGHVDLGQTFVSGLVGAATGGGSAVVSTGIRAGARAIAPRIAGSLGARVGAEAAANVAANAAVSTLAGRDSYRGEDAAADIATDIFAALTGRRFFGGARAGARAAADPATDAAAAGFRAGEREALGSVDVPTANAKIAAAGAEPGTRRLQPRGPDGKWQSPGAEPFERAGRAYEEEVWDEVDAIDGWEAIRHQISTRVDGQMRRYDGGARGPGGRVVGLEAKSGGARPTARQRTIDAGVNRGTPAHGVGRSKKITVSKVVTVRKGSNIRELL